MAPTPVRFVLQFYRTEDAFKKAKLVSLWNKLWFLLATFFVAYNSPVQLQAHGPHVARHSVFSDPLKYSGKIFKYEICWKACEVTFVSLRFLH